MGIEGNPQNLSAHSSDPQDDGNGTTEEHPKNSEAGKQIFETKNKTQEKSINLHNLSDQELATYTETFLGNEIIDIPQEDVDTKLKPLLSEIAQREIDAFALFAFTLPRSVSEEEIQSGSSPWAKVYRSLFNFSKETGYKQDPAFQRVTSTLESVVGQDPQMMGPVALWETAKDVMWRKDVPNERKIALRKMATHALTYYEKGEHEEELKKQLDFENVEKYSETAHMLEAIRAFWIQSNTEMFNAKEASDVYVRVLDDIENKDESNYLLAKRAAQLCGLLKEGRDAFSYSRVIERDIDDVPFELSDGIYAHSSVFSNALDAGLKIVPSNKVQEMKKSLGEDNEIKEQFKQGGYPDSLTKKRMHDLHVEINSYASIPIKKEVFKNVDNVSNEEIQELLFDYEYLVSKPVRNIIQEDFNFELKNLSIREQFYFLNYLKNTTNAEVEAMRSFITTYGTEGMRTFLSLENGDESLGDEIVEFANRENTVAEKVFSYYGELLDSTEKAEQIIHELSGEKETVDTELIDNVRKNILGRAQKDLEKAVREENTEKLEQMVSGYVTHAKEYVALLQEVGVGEIEKKHPEELLSEEKDQLRALLTSNYEHVYAEQVHEDFKHAVRDSLEKSFDNQNTEFKILRDGDDIVCYNRFDTLTDYEGNTVQYFGSFNARPEYSGVGEVMLKQNINKLLQQGEDILAHCDPEQPITKKYIEQGFIATDQVEFYGLPAFEIRQSPETSSVYATKDMDKEELLSTIENNQIKDFEIREKKDSESYKELRKGKVLTRYFEKAGKEYLVFESLKK